MDNATASLSLMLKQLKLATMVKEWDALGNKAVKEQMEPSAVLIGALPYRAGKPRR